MESGTDERYVRCRRCHGVFEAGLPNCSRCGAAYTPSPDAPEAGSGSYAEKYMGTQFAEQPEVPVSVPSGGRSGLGFLAAIGVALVVTALAVGGLVAMGAFEAPVPTPRQDIVVTRPATPTPVPTLPPVLTKTLAQLADPNLNMHVSIRTTVSVNARENVDARSVSSVVNMEVDCAGGNESGTQQIGAVTYEWRLVNGTYFQRRLPTGAWKAQPGFSPFIILSPLFSLSEPRMLQYDGADVLSGAPADKLESTPWWTPDPGKLSGVDVSSLGLNASPQHTKLVLWVGSDGSPLYATFRAWTDASDGTGTNLLNISTTYTFTNVGDVLPIPSPTIK